MGKLEKGWFEIFKGGPQRDSKGITVDGDAIIDKIISKFKSDGKTEAGLVFGHPDDDAPDYGGIADLGEYIRDGVRVLIAKPKNVVKSFAQQVKSGWLPGRSISVLPDGTLEHVGFLPANKPPAVGGMLPAEFQAGNRQLFFSEFQGEEEDFFAKLKSWFNRELAAANGIDPDLPNNDEEKMGKEAGKTFSQEDIDSATAEAAAKAKEEAKAEAKREFAEQQAQTAKEASDAAVVSWVDGKVKAGIIPPRWVDGGIVKAFQALDHARKYEFCKGEEHSPLEFFQGLIEDLENYGPISTKEFARRDTAPPTGKVDVQTETAAALAFQAAEAEKGNHISIARAVTAVRNAAKAGETNE